MKKILFLTFMMIALAGSAQVNWQPMYLTTSGHHVIDGVEGWFGTGDCNGSTRIFIRFVNTNSTGVDLQWYDGVFTQSRTWIYHADPADHKTLHLGPATDLAGQCSGEAVLIIEPAAFGIDAAAFFRYNAMDLSVSFK